jgi:hypothetical protein
MNGPDKFSVARSAADNIVRRLRSAHEGLEQLCGGTGGVFVKRMTYDGKPLVELVASERGGVTRQVWQCPLLAVLISAVRRGRVRTVCPNCQGNTFNGGCPACIGSGFIPEDESLAGAVPDNPAFELNRVA